MQWITRQIIFVSIAPNHLSDNPFVSGNGRSDEPFSTDQLSISSTAECSKLFFCLLN
uniref:Uncharacterized protein n=1 Tax=Oryza brachyantha TaxID=4533 RepID=J3L4C5_ORYBR